MQQKKENETISSHTDKEYVEISKNIFDMIKFKHVDKLNKV